MRLGMVWVGWVWVWGMVRVRGMVRGLQVRVRDRQALVSAVEVALQAVFFWATPIMVVAFVLSWLLREIPLRDTVGAAPPGEGIEEAQEYGRGAHIIGR